MNFLKMTPLQIRLATICSNGMVGAAGQTAPANPFEPPLQIFSVVVSETYERKYIFMIFKFNWRHVHFHLELLW
jgi:hypothetical protein